MKRKLTTILLFALILIKPLVSIEAQEEPISLSDLPWNGYYITNNDHAIEGLLFEDNQLYIYVADHQHQHQHGEEALPGDGFVHFLEELHSFPHPDLKNYNPDVRQLYLEEDNLPYDLQAVYEEITDLITADMSQTDIMKLINDRIPGIYYTEKNDYQYYLIASPTLYQEGDLWHIELFGNSLFTFSMEEMGKTITDQEGQTYQYVSGIRP